MPVDLLALTAALLTGLMGGLHCAAMCGGIATGLASQSPRGGLATAVAPFRAGRFGTSTMFRRCLIIATNSSSTSMSRTPWANASMPAFNRPLASDRLKMWAVTRSPFLCASSMIGP